MKSKVSAPKALLISAIIMLLPSVSMGITYSVTDITGISGITYQVALNTNGSGTITANVSGAILPSAAPWYIDAILLKLEPSGGLTNPSLTSHPVSIVPNTDWVATTSNNQVDLQKFSNLPMNGWTLFYFNGLLGNTIDNSGARLDGSSTYTWRFTFTPVASFMDTPSMQVIYYDDMNNGGKFITKRMSQELSPVPEPTTLLLLGAGLLGLAGFRRKFKK
jgi:hypothetical protein